MKNALATHLPPEVKLVVLTDRPFQANSLKRHYSKFTGKDRVDVLAFKYKSTSRALWARDNTPIPVLNKNSGGGASWSAVDAKYYGGDEPDSGIAQWFKVLLAKNQYEFEGGNFVTDAKGNCIIVNKLATAFIPDTIFTSLYGCKKVVRFKHLAGIGHADERVKFINDNLVLTDTESYIPELQSLGYDVRLLPKPEKGEFRTYVNSLSINDSLFVPIFNEPNDQLAIEVYRGTGKKIIPLDSAFLSDRGYGSIHCITMTYPPMPKEEFENIFR
jgi:agmatine/peptidylarginine deiminase